MTTAVIFIPAGRNHLYADQCYDYCTARGYRVAGVVTGDWDAVLEMLRNHSADVVVVARADHLDPNREPRVEVVGDGGPVPQDHSPERRRPRRLR